MRHEPEITTFSAMFYEMASLYSRVSRGGAPAQAAPLVPLSEPAAAEHDEAGIRAAMERALARRRKKQSTT